MIGGGGSRCVLKVKAFRVIKVLDRTLLLRNAFSNWTSSKILFIILKSASNKSWNHPHTCLYFICERMPQTIFFLPRLSLPRLLFPLPGRFSFIYVWTSFLPNSTLAFASFSLLLAIVDVSLQRNTKLEWFSRQLFWMNCASAGRGREGKKGLRCLV